MSKWITQGAFVGVINIDAPFGVGVCKKGGSLKILSNLSTSLLLRTYKLPFFAWA
jgi:hypothetical protein